MTDMTMTFDLVSDLHLSLGESVPGVNDPTSPICVVAGDVARDRDTVIRSLTDLADRYEYVIYVDGNDEHRLHYRDLADSYRDLQDRIAGIPRVVYLQDQMAVINDTAFVGANAWWTFDLSDRFTVAETYHGVCEHLDVNDEVCDAILAQALSDVQYLRASVRRLQTYRDVRNIVMVTHTLPFADFFRDDQDINMSWRINTTANPYLDQVLAEDTEHKIRAWCFGHYHPVVDQVRDNVRYVSNPRGRLGTPWCQPQYRPCTVVI